MQVKKDFETSVSESVTTTCDLDFDLYPSCQVLFIDEADFVLENAAFRYDKRNLQLLGLPLMQRVAKIYLFTATIPKIAEQLLKVLLNAQPKDRLSF